MYSRFFLTSVFTFIFVGCSGSGEKGSGSVQVIPSSDVIVQGVFVDSAVSGLKYTTPSQTGTTNLLGEFSYIATEQVVFSIGDIQFPAVEGKAMISPLDVFSVATTDDVRVSNMARLLQTLDVKTGLRVMGSVFLHKRIIKQWV